MTRADFVEVSTAEDVLGDVLLVLWRRAEDIPSEATLAWCYAVARRCLANSPRGAQRRTRSVTRLAELPPPASDDTDDPGLTEAFDAPGRSRSRAAAAVSMGAVGTARSRRCWTSARTPPASGCTGPPVG